MLLLLGHAFPFNFWLSGVIIPKRPPCFGIPFFDPSWFPHDPSPPIPRTVFIQDVCGPQLTTFAKVELDENVKTIPANRIKTLSLESMDQDVSLYDWESTGSPILLTSLERLYAFAETIDSVRMGHLNPLRTRLSTQSRAGGGTPLNLSTTGFVESGENHFTSLELARFRRDRALCLSALNACFASLEQHNRALAVLWLQMTKADLKNDGVLESTD